MSPDPAHYDVAILGAGFGGLATALTLAEGGARVVLLETLGYAGGCAATFERRGYRFEAGATLFSGFAEGQLMRRWIERHGLAVEHRILDPVVELRLAGLRLAVPPRREEWVERLCALPGAPVGGIRAFFDLQRRVADSLWPLFDEPWLLPPVSPRALLEHLRRAPSYLPLVRLVGRPLLAVLERFGVADFEPLRAYVDATCQITVQMPAARAEAPFALAAMDYYFRGTGHVEGGVGELAAALVTAIREQGGEVRFFERAEALAAVGAGWRVTTRRGVLQARAVAANLLPQAVQKLLVAGGAVPGGAVPAAAARRLTRRGERVAAGWGAAMLYLALSPGSLDRSSAHHLELIQDPSAPLIEGNHLFCSVSDAAERGRTPDGGRTVTVSTHLPMTRLRGLEGPARGEYVAKVQERMRSGLRRLAPEIAGAVVHELTASPRTFERFTGRTEGLVGGIPRRVGLAAYRDLLSRPPLPGLHLVGDSVFPGQSTLATAVGGTRLARRLLRRLDLPGRGDARPRGGSVES